MLAALILLVQVSLSTWAGVTMAAPSVVDYFGSAICTPNGASESRLPHGDHGGALDCCAFGCSSVSPALAGPSGAVLFAVALNIAGHLAPSAPAAPVFVGLDRGPGGPRAPPLGI